MALTRKEARRKLGSRNVRKANTNGKRNMTSGATCKYYRYPRPVKNLGPKIAKVLAEANQ